LILDDKSIDDYKKTPNWSETPQKWSRIKKRYVLIK